MRLYRVTVHYLTPSLRPSNCEGVYLADTPFEACEVARQSVRDDPRRRVRAVESCTCEPVRMWG